MAARGFTKDAPPAPTVTSCLAMSRGSGGAVAPAQRVVIFDFDQTIATTHVWQLLRGKKDPKLLGAVADCTLWGSDARLRDLQAMWGVLRRQNVGIHVVSHNWAPIVEAALRRGELLPDSVHGRETVKRKGPAVQQLLAALNVGAAQACFVDDDPSNVKDVSVSNPGIATILSPPTGLQTEHIQRLSGWASA
eukprot:TRINITY_DN25564_c0_g1_i1.p2 TRINITY_DN25564_c0_g1~~TRINITY_DN25564_c0_g1_i1.p2  ORF type:complete len:192 (+),score=71.21 TRINITY_DN25564_c0_g1_i1:78-653(+)